MTSPYRQLSASEKEGPGIFLDKKYCCDMIQALLYSQSSQFTLWPILTLLFSYILTIMNVSGIVLKIVFLLIIAFN